METDDFNSVEEDRSAVLTPAPIVLCHPDLHRIGDRSVRCLGARRDPYLHRR